MYARCVFYLIIVYFGPLKKYINICTSNHQLHIQTLYIIQDEVFTMDIKHLSNGQRSRKVVQLI